MFSRYSSMRQIVKCFLLITLVAACFTSCKTDNPVTPDPPSGQKEQTLISVLSEKSYTPQQFVDALGAPTMTAVLEYMDEHFPALTKLMEGVKMLTRLPELDRTFAKEVGTGPLGSRRWEVQSYTFSYRSQTVDGREIPMTGRVTFPNNKVEGKDHQVKTLSLHCHQAILGPDCAPSQSLMYMPMRALWDSAVIEPDMQHLGINYTKEYYGYGSHEVMAIQLADCVTAALEVMRMHGVTLAPDGYTTNWGNSQGGWTTLSFARYYETEAPEWFRDAVRLRSTFAGEGPCDVPSLLLDYACSHPEYLPSEINLLLGYFYAFKPEQLGGYSPEDFVAPWLNEKKYELADGRKISLLQAISYGMRDYDSDYYALNDMQQVLAPEMINPDGSINKESKKYKAWDHWLQTNQVFTGWTPEHPIYIAHCEDDHVVSYDCVVSLYNILSDNGNNLDVHLAKVPSIGEEAIKGFDPHYIISFIMQLQMACMKEPEDMMKIYIPVK